MFWHIFFQEASPLVIPGSSANLPPTEILSLNSELVQCFSPGSANKGTPECP